MIRYGLKDIVPILGKLFSKLLTEDIFSQALISSPVGQSDDSYLLKTDSLGEVLWEKTYGYYNKDEVGECLRQTIDNGFILAGTTVGTTGSSKNIWILKTDSVGDTLWTREIGATGIDEASSIIQTFDGNFLLAGYTDNGGSNPNSNFLLQLDSVGDTLWARSYSNVITRVHLFSKHQTADLLLPEERWPCQINTLMPY